MRKVQSVRVKNDEYECYSCHEFFALSSEFFYKSSGNKTGFRHQCKACVTEEKRNRNEKRIQNSSKSPMPGQSIG